MSAREVSRSRHRADLHAAFDVLITALLLGTPAGAGLGRWIGWFLVAACVVSGALSAYWLLNDRWLRKNEATR